MGSHAEVYRSASDDGRYLEPHLTELNIMACEECGTVLEPEVLKSAAGYYIGTLCPECGPNEKLSSWTYPDRDSAESDMWRFTGTPEQIAAYGRLGERWAKVGQPQSGFGCWMVEVTGEAGNTMWIGIEPDGHTHS